jgi:hypothetical protein
MTPADVASLLSRVGKEHPDLVSDEKVKRYILLVMEEAKRRNTPPPPSER